ncbi:hypothetical protein [Paraburkholderia sacchari]|uniref:hypothetical protein n=1 Tax=Paraburkholderia sacchari TaxID=159450 RepID=UPI0005421971|nr:hypothetical protein [Paraburkholderia sacchari]NLP63414.1 hypothetical protein [Paraburkholderia sacchari]
MEFLGADIGDNVGGHYRIEQLKDGKAPNPDAIPWSAERVGQYLVLIGDPVNNQKIRADNLIDQFAAIDQAPRIGDVPEIDRPFPSLDKSLLKDNKEVEGCICIGYMRLKIVMPVTSWVEHNAPPWTIQRTDYITDYIFATAYNVSLPEKAKKYQVHTSQSKGGQVHVEQICAYRLRAFLEHLSTNNEAKKQTVINLKTMRVRGAVKFSGKSSGKSSLHEACGGCVGVWTALKKEYPCLGDVELVFD